MLFGLNAGLKNDVGRRILASAAIPLVMAATILPASAQSVNGWPMLGRDSGHSFYSADSAVNASNAATFGVKWMANLYSADLGSPVVAFNSVLNKTVVYVGDNRADVTAVDAATGQTLWNTNVGLNDRMQSSPMVAPDGTVWAATSYNPTMYKLDGATGKVLCSVKSPTGLAINGSPMVATPPGGVTTVYWDTIDAGSINGPTIATNESTCATLFKFTNYITNPSGPWTTPAYNVDANGNPLVFVGTADKDSAEYAIAANAGTRNWAFSTYNPPPGDFDIGDAATTSAPGANGFADGVVYVNVKSGVEYALDLTTGAQIWQAKINSSRSSAALDGNALVVGSTGAVYDLNATTGALNWQYSDSSEILSSPAIVGPSGAEVVAFGDINGAFRLLGLSTGSSLYSYQTGGYITASAAEANGTVFIASSDGFLYAYGPGGGNSAPPTTTVTAPANLSQVPNPNGSLSITGTSTDPTGVKGVEVAVQMNGASGQWYNAATGTYAGAPVRNQATLANPGSTSTTWSLTLPAPAAGGTFAVFASSVNAGNIVDRGTSDYFTILASKGEPNIQLSTQFVSPGGSFTATSTGFTPGETVTFSLFGKAVATQIVSKTGHVPKTTIKVPTGSPFGPTSLSLTGMSSGKSTTATVGITNNWTQLGHDPAGGGFEPNDSIIAQSINVGPNGTVLSLSWEYPSGAPIHSSPAVVDGIAYVGNDAGTLSAVVTNTGAPQWSYTTPSGAPIRSSPAVDSSGSVVFGSNDGNLYVLAPSGTLLHSLALGGKLGAPTVASGQAFIGSDNGTLYDVSEATGTVTWSAALGAATHSTPTYDASANLVVIGDDSGAITAFNATTGAQVWKVATGGAVAAAPLIFAGTVFVGSGDDNFYALTETTGAQKWTYHLDAPVQAGAALFSTGAAITSLTVGDQKGTVYRFDFAGNLLYTLGSSAFHGPLVGMSAVNGNTFGETSTGYVAMIRMNGGTPSLAWRNQLQTDLASSPAIVDGTVYVGAGDGGLYAYSPHGSNPVPAHKGAPVITITNAWTCTTQ